jgi:nucleoside-diphosphate-sugar epimerase
MVRLLIAGFGDIGRRVARALDPGVELRTLSRSGGHDLDRPQTLRGIAGWADAVLHCAPPPPAGAGDSRTANLLAALEARILPARIVYVSTSGVYGDCSGALVEESREANPQTERARRRLDAECRLAAWCGARGVALVVLRAPGIYAEDRLPLGHLRAGTPVLRDEDDVYTNHIHADDLAAICVRALQDDAPPGIYNAADDSRLKMAGWLDLVAERAGLPRSPRIARSEAATRIPGELLGFMSESRLLDNAKLKRTLGVRLRYPTVQEGLRRGRVAGAD